jgi:hypothetical protein
MAAMLGIGRGALPDGAEDEAAGGSGCEGAAVEAAGGVGAAAGPVVLGGALETTPRGPWATVFHAPACRTQLPSSRFGIKDTHHWRRPDSPRSS